MSISDVVYDEATGLPEVGEDEFWVLGKNWVYLPYDSPAYDTYHFGNRPTVPMPGIRLDLKKGIYATDSGGWWRAPTRTLIRTITLHLATNEKVDNPTVEDIRKLAEKIMAQVAEAEQEKLDKADREKYFGTYPPKKLG